CSRRSAGPAALLRYCSSAACPITAPTRASRRAVSPSSGVTRYNPRGAGPVGARSLRGQREFIVAVSLRGAGWDNAWSTRIPRRGRHYPMNETAVAYRTWMCVVCGFIYDEAAGLPEEGIAPGTRWDDIPDTWTCPDCGVTKDDFEMMPA